MNINFTWGFYINNSLVNISADLTTDVEYYAKLKETLYVNRIKEWQLVRLGAQNRDGGYVMLGDISQSSYIAYSFGICDDVTWDNTMANLGFDIYMYDHTVEQLPFQKDKFHFFKEGIANEKKIDEPLDSLANYIKRNGHTEIKNMILKMDVEGAEWDFLDTVDTSTLKQFDQIVFELHNLVRADSQENLQKKISLLNKLNKTHQLVHLHGNNTGYIVKLGNTCFADVVETTYVLKEKYETYKDNNLVLPIDLDYPNDFNRPNVPLGKWNEPLVLN